MRFELTTYGCLRLYRKRSYKTVALIAQHFWLSFLLAKKVTRLSYRPILGMKIKLELKKVSESIVPREVSSVLSSCNYYVPAGFFSC